MKGVALECKIGQQKPIFLKRVKNKNQFLQITKHANLL